MFFRNLELTDYQKSLIGKKSERFFTKPILLAIAVNLIVLLCCYSLSYSQNAASINWAKFGIILYIIIEVASFMMFAIILFVFNLTEKLVEQNAYKEVFKKTYKLIPLSMSTPYQMWMWLVDLVLFVTLVTTGSFVWAVIHLSAAPATYYMQYKMYAKIISQLKKQSLPEIDENIDDLANKLFYRED